MVKPDSPNGGVTSTSFILFVAIEVRTSECRQKESSIDSKVCESEHAGTAEVPSLLKPHLETMLHHACAESLVAAAALLLVVVAQSEHFNGLVNLRECSPQQPQG